jgi:hypothetical protein
MGDWATTYHLLKTRSVDDSKAVAELLVSAAAIEQTGDPSRWHLRVGSLHHQLLQVETLQKWGYSAWVPGFVDSRHSLIGFAQVCTVYEWLATKSTSEFCFGWDYIAQVNGPPVAPAELQAAVGLGAIPGLIGRTAGLRLPSRVGFTRVEGSWWGESDPYEYTDPDWSADRCLELDVGRRLAANLERGEASFILGFEASGAKPVHTARLVVSPAHVKFEVSLVWNPLTEVRECGQPWVFYNERHDEQVVIL